MFGLSDTRRRRPATYGRQAHKPSYSLQANDSSPESSSKTFKASRNEPARTEVTLPPIAKPVSGNLVRPTAQKSTSSANVIFDVPSSSDEADSPKPLHN